MSYWSTVLADSPVFLLKMEEASGAIADAVGAKSGTATGSPTYQQAGPALGIPYGITYPSGTDHHFADHADFDLGDGPFTLEGWFKRGGADDARDLFGKGGVGDTTGYSVGISSTDRIGLRDGDGSQHATSTADLINNTNWHHVVVVRDLATTGIVYVDGSEASTTLVGAKTFTDNSADFVVGRRSVSNTAFGGTLAAVAIYKSVLSAGRVAAHYAARDDVGGVPPVSLSGLDALRSLTR